MFQTDPKALNGWMQRGGGFVLCAVDKHMGFPFLLCSPGNSFPLCKWQACNLGKKRVFSPTQVQFSGVDNTVSCQGILFQNNFFTTPKTSLQQQDVRRMSSLHAGSNWTSLDRCGGALQRSNWISHTWSQINKAPLHHDQDCTKKAVAVASCQWKFSSFFLSTIFYQALSFQKKVLNSSNQFVQGLLKMEFCFFFFPLSV